MSEEAWPTPASGPSREPLPRVEDLPIVGQGYEPESVKEAFDSFYRHAAQLDAALRTLEAVDSFHRHAAALRADLRALRGGGWTQQSWDARPPYGYGYSTRGQREGISPAVWRIAGEVAFLVAASVALGVAKVSWWVIVGGMALAFLIVVAIEWLATRDQFAFARAPVAPPLPVVEAAPVTLTAEEEASGWHAFEEAQEPSDAMTMIAPAGEDGEPPGESVVEESTEPEPEVSADAEPKAEEEPVVEAEAEPVSEPEPVVEAVAADEAGSRRRWFRRRDHDVSSESDEPSVDLPHHVRVLSPDEQSAASDPWEQGFDEAAADEPASDETADAGEDTAEGTPALAGDSEQSGRRRFRRR